ncbi:MAG: hypothetical protein WD016_01705 [Balneolaceae bacterium]
MKYSTRKRFIKGHIFIFLLFFLSMFLSQIVSAQNNIRTKVMLTSGLDASVNAEIEVKIEALLLAINELSFNEENIFSGEPGVSKLVELVKPQKFVSNLDEINTYIIITEEETYEIPQLYIRPLDGNEFSYEELELTFSKSTELIDAKITGKERNYQRILRRASEADEAEKATVNNMLEDYKNAFSDKNVRKVRSLFNQNSSIITGSRRKSDGLLVFNRYSYDDYMQRLEDRVLTTYNTINIRFEDGKIYRHPDFRESFGFYAKQYYNTPSYSDTGYVFMIWDFSTTEEPKIISRTWQEQSFGLSQYSEVVAPKPRQLTARLTDVRTRVDNSNLSLTKTMPRDQGLLQIELETNDLSLINASIAEDWINENILTFTNLELMTGFIEIIDSTNIRVPFKTKWEQGMQRVGTELEIRGTSVIDDFKSNQSLYLQRLNIMTVKILSREEEKIMEEQKIAAAKDTTTVEESEYDFAEEFAFEGKVKFKTNVDDIHIKIFLEGEQILFDEVQKDRDFEYQLLEGDYAVEFTKEGYEPRNINILILKTEIMEHTLIMR